MKEILKLILKILCRMVMKSSVFYTKAAEKDIIKLIELVNNFKEE